MTLRSRMKTNILKLTSLSIKLGRVLKLGRAMTQNLKLFLLMTRSGRENQLKMMMTHRANHLKEQRKLKPPVTGQAE